MQEWALCEIVWHDVEVAIMYRHDNEMMYKALCDTMCIGMGILL